MRSCLFLFLASCSIAGSDASSSVDLDPRVPDLMDRVQMLETNQQQIAQRSLQNMQLQDKVAHLEKRVEMVCDVAALQAVQSGPNLPRGSVPRVPRQLASLVTDRVVRSAIQQSMSYWAPSHGTRTPLYNARSAAFDRAASLGGHELYHPTYEAWRLNVLDLARQELEDPARLDAIYRRHRSAVVDELRRLDKASEVKAYLEAQVLPAFEQPVSPQSRQLHRQSSQRWAQSRALDYQHPCWREVRKKHDEAQTAFQASVTASPLAVQFRLRREAEGGAPLVKAWAGILRDLAERL